mmetsp:Transcript_2274/g.7608  ORF Transcript_2274/g.7608 Transcript_2274/m.7608 type:complete len:216 (-) Transcript_2274:366-1013(-)
MTCTTFSRRRSADHRIDRSSRPPPSSRVPRSFASRTIIGIIRWLPTPSSFSLILGRSGASITTMRATTRGSSSYPTTTTIHRCLRRTRGCQTPTTPVPSTPTTTTNVRESNARDLGCRFVSTSATKLPRSSLRPSLTAFSKRRRTFATTGATHERGAPRASSESSSNAGSPSASISAAPLSTAVSSSSLVRLQLFPGSPPCSRVAATTPSSTSSR